MLSEHNTNVIIRTSIYQIVILTKKKNLIAYDKHFNDLILFWLQKGKEQKDYLNSFKEIWSPKIKVFAMETTEMYITECADDADPHDQTTWTVPMLLTKLYFPSRKLAVTSINVFNQSYIWSMYFYLHYTCGVFSKRF